MKNNNINVNDFKNAAQNGKLDDYINKHLSKEANQKLQSILSDKQATEKLLNTPQAKQLFDKLMKG